MPILGFKNKIKEILESYIIYIGYKMAFIKDQELTEQITHRQAMCKDCVLNRAGWCSKRRKTLTIIDGLHTLVRGCSCWIPAKLVSEFKHDSCPLRKWEK